MKNKLITIMFVGYILLFTIGTIVAKDRKFSDMENRNLEQKPELNKETLLDGSFMDNYEKYVSDQIIFKDSLVRLKVLENKLLNQKYINGVYFSKDDMLIQKYDMPYNQLSQNIGFINEFAEANTDLNCTMLVAPNASLVYKDKLPAYADSYDQAEVLAYIHDSVSDKVNMVDCSKELLANKEDYIYYRTDHHWTINGAYIGYQVLCDALKIKATDKSQYEITTARNNFYGTLYSKAPTFTQKADDIILYNNKAGEYLVEYTDTKESDTSLYTTANLDIKDKYTTYLDGNHSIMKISSNATSCEDEECKHKLLVVKDSYAHSLLPLLADNYSEIIVVDLRYYHQSVSDLARENGITDVVFINNLEFISTDNNFLWLM